MKDQFKVLKTMSEATNRMDINTLAKKVNLNSNQTLQKIQELAKEGFLQKVGSGYGITEKGKVAIKAFASVPEEMGFHFYTALEKPTNSTALSIEEFYRIVKTINVDSLEFHLYRGDFEKWTKEACKDPELSGEIVSLKAKGLDGENLRVELLEVLETKFGFEELF